MRDFYISEQNYLTDMKEKVLPFINSFRIEGVFKGYDDKDIHFVKYIIENPTAAVIISHGFTESSEKWHELTYYFLKSGFNVYIIDHRGHGLSYREVKDLTLTHVNDFDEYIEDFEIFCDYAGKEEQGDIYLFAHSMGGAIGALFMEKNPCYFKKAVLSSPMIAPSPGNVPYFLGKFILGSACFFGQRKKRAFTSKPYTGEEKFEDSCKTSKVRFEEYDALKRATPYLQNSCMTYGWGLEAVKVKNKILKEGEPEKITTKLKIASAELDDVVLNKPQFEFASRVKDAEIRTFSGAKHEIYGSKDEVAFPYFDYILNFFEE